MPHIIDYNAGSISVELYKSGMTDKIYDVTLESGTWPPAKWLIDIVDGGNPASKYYEPLHKGGKVEPVIMNDQGKPYTTVTIYR